MTFTDYKRHEVAARMRDILRVSPDIPLDMLAAKAMNDCLETGLTYGETLANLIDLPTCHLIVDEDGYTACSECGCTALCMSDATFCPDCGARVVRKGANDAQ